MDDLDELGVHIDDRAELDRHASDVAFMATTAYVTTHTSAEPTGLERADVVVGCDHE